MVTLKEILKKNNLTLKLNQGLLSLDVGNKDYKFVDAYVESGDTCRGLDYNKFTKTFHFKSSDGHNLVIYPDVPDYTLWLSICSCYYDENGRLFTEILFD